MRKLLPLAVALSATFAMMGAHALVITIDTFNIPAGSQSVIDLDPSDGAVFQSSGAVNPSTDTISYATSRVLAVNCISATNTSAVNACATASAGTAEGSILTISAGNNKKAAGRVTWILPPNPNLVSPASFFFQIIANTTGTPGNVPTNVDFDFNGLSDGGATPGNDFNLTNQNFGSVAGVPAAFALTPAQVNSLKVGGTLIMDLTSTGTGWSISLDDFSLFTPEPTSLALVGLALVGAGLASRRRKA